MLHWHLFQFDWPTVSENDDAKETQMLYKFDYLPPGLFNRAQVSIDVEGFGAQLLTTSQGYIVIDK